MVSNNDNDQFYGLLLRTIETSWCLIWSDLHGTFQKDLHAGSWDAVMLKCEMSFFEQHFIMPVWFSEKEESWNTCILKKTLPGSFLDSELNDYFWGKIKKIILSKTEINIVSSLFCGFWVFFFCWNLATFHTSFNLVPFKRNVNLFYFFLWYPRYQIKKNHTKAIKK